MSRIYGEGTTERLRVQIEKLMVSFQTHKPEKISAVEETTVEANFKGQWLKIPALNINGTTITVAGSWFKTAVVYDEEWLERELQDPETCIQRLKERIGKHVARRRLHIFPEIARNDPQVFLPHGVGKRRRGSDHEL